jgi:hypothetical protein
MATPFGWRASVLSRTLPNAVAEGCVAGAHRLGFATAASSGDCVGGDRLQINAVLGHHLRCVRCPVVEPPLRMAAHGIPLGEESDRSVEVRATDLDPLCEPHPIPARQRTEWDRCSFGLECPHDGAPRIPIIQPELGMPAQRHEVICRCRQSVSPAGGQALGKTVDANQRRAGNTPRRRDRPVTPWTLSADMPAAARARRAGSSGPLSSRTRRRCRRPAAGLRSDRALTIAACSRYVEFRPAMWLSLYVAECSRTYLP